jgi:hypothetical protein
VMLEAWCCVFQPCNSSRWAAILVNDKVAESLMPADDPLYVCGLKVGMKLWIKKLQNARQVDSKL